MVRSPCCEEINLKKGPWTPEEDEKLVDHINKHGIANWKTLPNKAGLNRCGKSCRLRWTNYLRPDIKRGKFTQDEERIIINLHSVLGNKWSKIATHLPGRTDNEIKNFWNTHIRKKLLQMGIDPITHKPRTDFNHLLSLSQLLSSAQLGNSFINNNIGLMLQADTTQLAKLQLLQNLMLLLNSSSLLGTTNNQNGLNYPLETNMVSPSGLVLSNSQANETNSWFEQQLGLNKINDGNTLPPLDSRSPDETSSMEENNKNVTRHHQDNSSTNMFEDLERLLDDQTSGSYWEDLLDLSSLPPSAESW